MPAYAEEKCTKCGKHCSKELLTVKKVAFARMGSSQKVIKTRTVAWLCESCRDADSDWNRKRYDAPGTKSAGLERVRKANGED